jgi:hypothetical protein
MMGESKLFGNDFAEVGHGRCCVWGILKLVSVRDACMIQNSLVWNIIGNTWTTRLVLPQFEMMC